ncbi:MAG TPA: ChbG/HpnK family deacetylase, partial [Candidatus Faecalibacterium intestinigallinarum]|nr:ChbG/HpnK family deacetylase [Candidatus Faecalibacterium intestinigallinarum]
MKRLLIRADDLGYSEGINCGIAAAVAAGLVRSVGVMTNMPAAVHGLGLLYGRPL